VTGGRRLAATALVWVLAFTGLRFTFLAPERCPTVPPEGFVASAAAAGAWVERGFGSDDRYLYEYDRDGDRVLPGYNIVRHAGVTMSLYHLARAGSHDAVDTADTALLLLLGMLVPAGDGLAVVEPNAPARLGASALTAAALAQRRAATGDPRYDDELRSLGRFMAGQITEGGQMLATYDLESGRPVPGQTSRYATGEAAWALAQLHNLFPDEGWDAPARRVLDYLATARDEVEDLRFRPWADQWAAYTLGELAPSGLDEHHRTYARALAGRFGMLVRSESQKETWPVAFVDHRARGAGLGVWVEGLGALRDAAEHDDELRDLVGPIQERLECGAAILLDRQQSGSASRRWSSPDLVDGAWFRDDVTRMDDQQHALSGLLAAAGALGPVGS
jgi:hypothetical protein